MAIWTASVAEAEAAAYVASPAKATPTRYEPVAAGAFVLTEATPELFVVALKVPPFSVNVTVLPAIATAPDVMSVPERVIEAPGAAVVGPEHR